MREQEVKAERRGQEEKSINCLLTHSGWGSSRS
jgi:hypothetical protein